MTASFRFFLSFFLLLLHFLISWLTWRLLPLITNSRIIVAFNYLMLGKIIFLFWYCSRDFGCSFMKIKLVLSPHKYYPENWLLSLHILYAGVATAFASRDILGNVLSGLSMQFSKPFSLGDTIKVCSTCSLLLKTIISEPSIKLSFLCLIAP